MRYFIQLMLAFLINFQVIASQEDVEMDAEHKMWLQEKFSDQHQSLIPIVAVADMYFACNRDRNIEPARYPVAKLVMQTDKDELAQKLSHCLGKQTVKSEVAVNYGLQGCFEEQLSRFPKKEKQQKMALVNKAIASLSLEEKQKSFSKCVTQQAIRYLR
ncbi:hypothetical protein [Thalassotalea fusca]